MRAYEVVESGISRAAIIRRLSVRDRGMAEVVVVIVGRRRSRDVFFRDNLSHVVIS